MFRRPATVIRLTPEDVLEYDDSQEQKRQNQLEVVAEKTGEIGQQEPEDDTPEDEKQRRARNQRLGLG